VIALAALLLAAAPAADTPRAFLARLYARYERGDLNPIPRQEKIYAPELVRQMRLNAKLYGPNEVGLIDYDPVCQCQDMSEMKARIGEIAAAGPGRAEAKVSIGFGHQTERQAIRIKLLHTPAGWRIADIGSREQPSLLGDLQRDNRRLARRKP